LASDLSKKTRQIGQLPDTSDQLDKPIWAQPRTGFRWEGPIITGPLVQDSFGFPSARPAGKQWVFSWDTPWFDLRPDLKSIEGQPKLGVPIWSRSARLYVELVGRSSEQPLPPGTPLVFSDLGIYPGNYTATMREYYDTTNIEPGQMISQGPGKRNVTYPNTDLQLNNSPVDVTSTFFPPVQNRIATSLGVFYPPGTNTGGGEGYPVRYWKVSLRFVYTATDEDIELFTTWSFPPIISLQATYY